MRKPVFAIATVVLLCGASAPAGCNGQITPEQAALIQSDLDTFCPIIGAADATIRQVGNGNVQKALNTLELACPPNPPPTNLVVIGADMLAAVTVIQPYINAYLKSHHVKL